MPQYDSQHDRFFFVDTLGPGAPRSVWVHPMDNPEWQKTVPKGMDPLAYIDKLWQEQPMPTPEPQRRHISDYTGVTGQVED